MPKSGQKAAQLSSAKQDFHISISQGAYCFQKYIIAVDTNMMFLISTDCKDKI